MLPCEYALTFIILSGLVVFSFLVAFKEGA